MRLILLRNVFHLSKCRYFEKLMFVLFAKINYFTYRVGNKQLYFSCFLWRAKQINNFLYLRNSISLQIVVFNLRTIVLVFQA